MKNQILMKNLNEMVRDAGSVSKLGELAGIQRSTLDKCLKRETGLSTPNLIKLSEYLGITVDDILKNNIRIERKVIVEEN